MARRRKILNPTAAHFHNGLLRFKRRVDFPCWHIDHVRKLISMLRETADALEEVCQMNAARDADKVFYAQQAIMRLNWDATRLTPKDPRERGAAQYSYDHRGGRNLVDMNGIAHVEAREDLQEMDLGPNARAALNEARGVEPGKTTTAAVAARQSRAGANKRWAR